MNTVENWDEIRTAYQVARLGTVSGAAEALGVHHATVIRHVDALERSLGVKLFQRHPRGYTATEAGEDLLQVAKATDDQFTQLAGRIRGRGASVTGEVVVTSLTLLSGQITPLLVEFQEAHPELTVRFLTDERVFRLEYGEAHVAIRAGRQPDQPDNVVQHFYRYEVGLYAHRSYFERYGPLEPGKWEKHRYIGTEEGMNRAPFFHWLENTVPAECIRYRVSHIKPLEDAVRAGAGIGFIPNWIAEEDPDLVEMMPPEESWGSDAWIVTHVDLHRTAKVQTLVKFLRSRVKDSVPIRR